MTAPTDPTLARLRRLTPARLRLDPRGGAAPLSAVLDFQASHARARDAIRAPVEWEAIAAALAPHATLSVQSRAGDRETYLRRPDLGRRVRAADLERMQDAGSDVAIVIADGLSALAVNRHAAAIAAGVMDALPRVSFAPVVLASEARVAIGDDIGAGLRARLSLVLIGERPGLSVAESLGAYITYDPCPGRQDSERNCVSNIHDLGGLSHERAVELISWLVGEALSRRLTGIALKDESGGSLLGES
ncbi:ethanolamine ammonia-lyase subunit EutC [Haematobacter genomosp. 1]|uniref:Ethanolamine ammonia-lyase small subunit n=1 Tax=Haematobacter genomosp. 1 TaxID=366618 RepID=A0A212AG61_9RHOB|nr:ethanolamine ammonia-lyase subunit EutC [Haematobacter genomosp. 1]OWJ80498.1 ethanolamine ammonia-lyase [Haematobacter genomosp. 1]